MGAPRDWHGIAYLSQNSGLAFLGAACPFSFRSMRAKEPVGLEPSFELSPPRPRSRAERGAPGHSLGSSLGSALSGAAATFSPAKRIGSEGIEAESCLFDLR